MMPFASMLQRDTVEPGGDPVPGRTVILHRLGIVALGTLLGSLPLLATAGEQDGSLVLRAPPTAASSLALLQVQAAAPTITVTTAADVVDPGDGKLSLREAVAKANATAALDEIVFKPSLEGQTLVLTGGELVVTNDLAIDGYRDDDGSAVTIDGNRNGRILKITGGGTDVDLRELTLTNANSGAGENGGAILVGGGRLAMTGTTIRDNQAGAGYGSESGGAGGGIFAEAGSQVELIHSSLLGNEAVYGSGGGLGTGAGVTLAIRDCQVAGNRASGYGYGGGISLSPGGSLVIQDSEFVGNSGGYFGGALSLIGSSVTILRSTISGNSATYGGGIETHNSHTTLSDSTVEGNRIGGAAGGGAGILAFDNGVLAVRNSTITGNSDLSGPFPTGAGIRIFAGSSTRLDLVNSIVAGNYNPNLPRPAGADDILGTITFSNGHNVFGTDVKGSIPGDRESESPGAIFATINPATGGGRLSATGIVPLKSSVTNPAVSGADPLTASATGQLGTTPRPLPAGSLPDLGSVEINQPLSTSATFNNDVITGSAAANNLSGLAGNDLIRGLGANDTINAGDGSDVLDGGPGNDLLNGGTGVDLVTYAGAVAVVVDLSGTTDTARRGGETDTLTGIEGAIGSSKADTFKGDAGANEFQGGLGKDRYTGGGGRDLYDFNAVAESPAGAGRDVVTDFAPGQDVIDLAGIDADATIPGDQSFRWVGKATLTGAAQLGYYVAGGNTIVRASTDADGAAELEIQLTGKKVLTAADFVP
jgi:serralysin